MSFFPADMEFTFPVMEEDVYSSSSSGYGSMSDSSSDKSLASSSDSQSDKSLYASRFGSFKMLDSRSKRNVNVGLCPVS